MCCIDKFYYNCAQSRFFHQFSILLYANNEIKVMFNYNNYYNDLVLFNINKDLNVDDLISRVVEKYS